MDRKKQTFSARYNFVLVLFIIAIVLSVLFSLFPLNRLLHSSDEVKKVYFAENITPAHREIIRRFNEKHAGRIEIVPVDLPFRKFNTNERKELIARTLRNPNSRIDVFTVDQIWVPRFAKWAEPLSRWFSALERDRILDCALSTCFYEKTLVSVPLHVDIGVLYFRKDMVASFANAAAVEKKLRDSMSWKDFLALNRETGRNRPFYLFPGDNYEGLVCNFLELWAGQGGSLLENGVLQLHSDEALNSCRFMNRLISQDRISPREIIAFNESATYDFALRNDVPFFRGWPSFRREALDHPLGREKAGLLGVAALPHFEGMHPTSAYGGWNLMISRHSTKKEEAVLFLKYMLSEEVQSILTRTAGFLPVLNRCYGPDSCSALGEDAAFWKTLLDRGFHRPPHPNYTKISSLISPFLHRALSGEISPEAAISGAERAVLDSQVLTY